MTETRAKLVAKRRIQEAAEELSAAIHAYYGLTPDDEVTITVKLPRPFTAAQKHLTKDITG